MYVLIATYGRPDLLARTLSSLSEVCRPSSLRRVIVVENGSDSGAREICHRVSATLPLEYFHYEVSGKSRALQWAVDHVVDDGLVVMFDDDVRLSANVLIAYEVAFKTYGEGTFFGGPFGVDYEEPPRAWLLPYLPSSAKGWALNEQIDCRGRTLHFSGCNYAVPAAAIREVGGFNQALGPGAVLAGTEGNPVGQESDLQRRLRASGYAPTYVPEAMVWHYVPKSRSSAAWALHRAYRDGMGAGIRLLQNDERVGSVPMVFGKPRWVLRSRLQAIFMARLCSLLGLGAGRGFFWRVRAARMDGYLAAFSAKLFDPNRGRRNA